MNSKKYSQFGTFSVIVLLSILIFSIIMIFTLGLSETHILVIFSIISVTMLVSLIFFYKLTIIIDDTYISFKLGIGLYGRKYRIDNLKSCRPVKNSILDGVGVKMLMNGWLYNVSGLKAVELTFKDKKSIIRIGTNRPEEIAGIVTKLINHDNPIITDEKNKRRSKKNLIALISIILITLLIPAILILYGNQEVKIQLTNDSFEIKGMYGISVKCIDINQIDTLSSMPEIKLKTNGYAFGKICKGNFKLSGINNAKLFINCGNSPYLHLRLDNNKNIFINFKDNRKTIELYKDLKEKIIQK